MFIDMSKGESCLYLNVLNQYVEFHICEGIIKGDIYVQNMQVSKLASRLSYLTSLFTDFYINIYKFLVSIPC